MRYIPHWQFDATINSDEIADLMRGFSDFTVGDYKADFTTKLGLEKYWSKYMIGLFISCLFRSS